MNGNSKNWQVQYRDSATERAEQRAYGCTNVDDWSLSPVLRRTQADSMIERLERIGCEWRLINTKTGGR